MLKKWNKEYEKTISKIDETTSALWNKVYDNLSRIAGPSFSTVFSDVKLAFIKGDEAVLIAKEIQIAKHIKKLYSGKLKTILHEITGENYSITIKPDKKEFTI